MAVFWDTNSGTNHRTQKSPTADVSGEYFMSKGKAGQDALGRALTGGQL